MKSAIPELKSVIDVEICQSGVIIGEKLRLGGKAAMVEWRLEKVGRNRKIIYCKMC